MTVREYKGARYVPLFMGDWDVNADYEPLSIVQYQGNSYTSRQAVPHGVEITNEAYWAKTGNYNAQVEAYRQEVLACDGRITDNANDIAAINDALPIADYNANATVTDAIRAVEKSANAKFQDVEKSANAKFQDVENKLAEKAFSFKTVADMKAAENLFDGAICHTSGFNSIGDGGAAWYTISDTGTANEMDVIACGDLLAHLNVENKVYLEQLGCTLDGYKDETDILQYALNTYNAIEIRAIDGTCLVSNSIEVRTNTHLIAERKLVIKWANKLGIAGSKFGNTANSLQDCRFENIKFDFGSQDKLAHSISIECSKLAFVNCEFTNGYGYMIRITGSSDFKFENCHFHDITGAGGNPGGGIYGQRISNGIIRNCIFDTLDDHAFYSDGDNASVVNNNIRLIGNYFTKCGVGGFTGGDAVTVYSNSKNIVVDGNNFYDTKGGVMVSDHGYTISPTNIVISNNSFSNITDNGVSLSGSSTARVKNCVVSGNTFFAIGQDAISLRYCDKSTVANNNIHDFVRQGIELSYADMNVVNGNTICVSDSNSIGVILGRTGDQYCYKNSLVNNMLINENNLSGNSLGFYLRRQENTFLANNFVDEGLNNNGNVAYKAKGTQLSGSFAEERAIRYVSKTPTDYSQYYNVGDICIKNNPVAGQPAMWICTSAGNPGTHKVIATAAS